MRVAIRVMNLPEIKDMELRSTSMLCGQKVRRRSTEEVLLDILYHSIRTGSRLQNNSYQLGFEYEQRAADYLINNGYQILDRNFRSHKGEIDLIALDPNRCPVFVEVKYRRNNRFGSPGEAVDARKQLRICQTAVRYLKGRPSAFRGQCRFDVIEFCGNDLHHIKHAFEYRGC